MMKRIPFLLLVLPLLTSCEDAADNLFPKAQPVQLPAATQAGANTFGCEVNGQVWEASNTSTLAGTVLTPKAQYQHGHLRLEAFRRLQVNGPVTNFYFAADAVTRPGVYALRRPGSARLETLSGHVGYVADTVRFGTLTITRLDTAGAHPVVSGQFTVRAVPRPGAQLTADFPAELQVTAGRFDIQLNRR